MKDKIDKEQGIVYMNPKELKFRTNVRWRADSNLSELMESIKQHGILQPIQVRTEDKTIIYGHRRNGAAIKLGIEKVPVLFRSNISDKEANILNLLENMQRKDVTSLEIGRQCDLMLKNTEFNLSINELATAIGVSSNRIKVCLDVFKRLPEKYRKQVVHITDSKNRKYGQLPENVVYAILNFNRSWKNLSANELEYFLDVAASEKLTVSQIALVGRLMSGGMSFKCALKELNLYTVTRISLPMLKEELKNAMKIENVITKTDFCRKIFLKAYPNLVF